MAMVFENFSFSYLRTLRAFLVKVIGNDNHRACYSKDDFLDYFSRLFCNRMTLVIPLLELFDWVRENGFEPTMKTKLTSFKEYFNYTVNDNRVTLQSPRGNHYRCELTLLTDLIIEPVPRPFIRYRRPSSPIPRTVVRLDSDDDSDDDLIAIARLESLTSQQPIFENIYGDYSPQTSRIAQPIRLCSNHLEDIEDEPATIPELECKICVTNRQCVAITKCGHVFCKSCVLKCEVCPTCRLRYSPNDLLRLFM